MSDLKYGVVDGQPQHTFWGVTGTLITSGLLPAKSGRLVVYDVSDTTWKQCADNAAYITGYVEQVFPTAASCPAGTKVPIVSVKGHVFELPFARSGAAATLTQAILDAIVGLKIDIYVDGSYIQYADDANSGTAGNQAVLLVEGGNLANNTLYVSVVDSAITSQA